MSDLQTFTFSQAVEGLAHGIPIKRLSIKQADAVYPEQEFYHFNLDDLLATDWVDYSDPDIVNEYIANHTLQ